MAKSSFKKPILSRTQILWKVLWGQTERQGQELVPSCGQWRHSSRAWEGQDFHPRGCVAPYHSSSLGRDISSVSTGPGYEGWRTLPRTVSIPPEATKCLSSFSLLYFLLQTSPLQSPHWHNTNPISRRFGLVSSRTSSLGCFQVLESNCV